MTESFDFGPTGPNSPSAPITQVVFDKFQERLYAVVAGVLLVLGLGFVSLIFALGAMIQESNHFKAESYNQLNSNVIRLNEAINLKLPPEETVISAPK